MKKMYLVLFAVFATFMLNACSSNVLIIYTPKDYMSEAVVMAFEAEFGVEVEIRQFESNEVALTQARINRYDLIIPSDYAIEEFAEEGLIKELDWEKIDFDDAAFTAALVSILAELEDEGFDLLKYAFPYFWGTIGLIYD